MSTILLHSDMLLKGCVDSDEEKTEYLSTIGKNCRRLTRLINDVLDLSKIEAGRMPFKLESLNIKAVVDEVLITFHPIIESKKIHIVSEIAGDKSLLGDRDRIIQVVTNIVSNAIKYSNDGGAISITLTCSNKKGAVKIQDTGEGIRTQDIPKVFDRFSQLESINHHSEGTGLGMAISKSIIEKLDGSIWIESEVGKGTSVCFTLPISEHVEILSQIQVPEKEMKNSVKPGHRTVLIIDDENDLRSALTKCIRKAGFDTIEAANGDEALHFIEERQPDLILVDVMMPGISGIEVCRILRNDPKTSGIKIIMLSARGQIKEQEEGLNAGADRYITKPFDYVELMRVVEELLSKPRRH